MSDDLALPICSQSAVFDSDLIEVFDLPEPAEYDHFSSGIAYKIVKGISPYLCEQMHWSEGEEIFSLIMSYLIHEGKADNDCQPGWGLKVTAEVLEASECLLSMSSSAPDAVNNSLGLDYLDPLAELALSPFFSESSSTAVSPMLALSPY